MKLSDFMITDAITPELESSDRDGVIRELVQTLARAQNIDPAQTENIIIKIIEREQQGSTGIGKGIAIPHIKHPAVNKIVGTIGCKKDGVEFASLDKAPVYSVMLLLSPPNNPDQHLEAMEALFAHLQRDMFRKFLRQAETREAIVDLIKEADDSNQENGL
jgi:mannitol/fructose-specific phosphotransferase system IIA component (Ntr-type)